MPPITLEKKIFRYYAIRVGGMIIIRRTVDKLKMVKSVLYNKDKSFALTQIAYVGGKVIGTLGYLEWCNRVSFTGSKIGNNCCIPVKRDIIMSLKPFLQKGE